MSGDACNAGMFVTYIDLVSNFDFVVLVEHLSPSIMAFAHTFSGAQLCMRYSDRMPACPSVSGGF